MDIQNFTDKLIDITAQELWFWRNRFAFETMRAFDMGCYPWHGRLELSFLTVQEQFDEQECGKWAVGGWRLYNFTQTWDSSWPRATSLLKSMEQQYQASNDPMITEKLFIACAKAITSEQVMRELQRYKLTPDFEIAVFNKDEPRSETNNYCRRVGI